MTSSVGSSSAHIDFAASYEGFRNQMSMERGAEDSSPASHNLAMKTLDAIHAPPGRMYDKKGDSHTPLDGLAKSVVEGVVEGLKLKNLG